MYWFDAYIRNAKYQHLLQFHYCYNEKYVHQSFINQSQIEVLV